MNFPIPITIIIAAIFFTVNAVEQKLTLKSEVEPEAPDSAMVIVMDTVIVVPVITSTIIAPPIEFPAEETLLGYRVQILSSESQSNAQALMERLKFSLTHSIHLEYKDDNWKVRVGDFASKEEAQLVYQELRAGEFPDAFIVQSPICQYIDGFRVQLASLVNHSSAASYARAVENKVSVPVYIIKEGESWKVRLGDFTDEAAAKVLRDEMTAKGYSDAWVTTDKVKLVKN